ncbi:MAG TPA: uroporphyrinogen decarboxylase family protein [Candidatus Aminicenantes bacterium]|nr:uroporphyrinogen decarboxylase family protein [Candidatus Aminicenantes bacterium]
MTKRERVEKTFRLEKADRIPFVPAVYEHKGALIGETPSAIARDAGLLEKSLLRELAVYDPDMLVVGVDVYNVEAEALGCRVRFFDASPDVPAIESTPLDRLEDAGKLVPPDPEKDGRMPVLLKAAEAVHEKCGRDMIVRGALTGPFSMACEIAGLERVLIASIDNPPLVRRLLDITAEVTVAFGLAYLARGIETIIFDSRATPGVASPRVFREFVLPVYRDRVMPALAAGGAGPVPLIIGGNTTAVLEDLLATGAGQLLCDAGSDLERFRARCGERRLPLRANVDARLVHRGPADEIRRRALDILRRAGAQPGFLMGCGVVAYDCPPAHVLAVKEAIEEFCGGRPRP